MDINHVKHNRSHRKKILQETTDETIRVVEIFNDLNSKWRTLKGYFHKPVYFIIGGSKRDHLSNGEKIIC